MVATCLMSVHSIRCRVPATSKVADVIGLEDMPILLSQYIFNSASVKAVRSLWPFYRCDGRRSKQVWPPFYVTIISTEEVIKEY